jgi:hypothetical protein
MSLETIEKLFVIRSNLLAMGDLRSIWRTPLLFLMALLVWCLGIATIYPPGALIVTFEAHNYTENRNVSVMNPPVPQNLKFYTEDETNFPTLGQRMFTYTVTGSDDDDNNQVDGRAFSYWYAITSTLHTLLNTK